MGTMAGGRIVGIVLGVLISIMGIALYPNYAQGFDELYRIYVPTCTVGGNSTLIVHAPKAIAADAINGPTTAVAAGEIFELQESAGKCSIPGFLTGTQNTASITGLAREDGSSISAKQDAADNVAMSVSGGTWKEPAEVLSKFGGINKLLTSIGPMLVLVGFATTGILVSRNYSGSIGSVLTTQVIGLIAALMGINMLPVVVDFIQASAGATDDELSATQQFGGILDLLWSLLPLLGNLTVISMVVWSGYSLAQGKGGDSKEGQAQIM